MKKRYKALSVFLWILLFIVAWGWLLTFYSPKEIVAYIWVEEWYLLIFLISIIGWVSTIAATSFYTTIMTFIAWWLSLFIVWILAWSWATIGDSLFYYMWIKLKQWFFKKKTHYFNKIHHWVNNKPRWVVFISIYLYAGFTPLPKDALIIALALSWYSFKKIFLPLVLWNITLMIVLWYLTLKGIEIF
jgi:hypothetical protein